MDNEYTKPSKLGFANNKITSLKIEVKALGECIENYEGAIRDQQALTNIAEKEAKEANKKLERLIKIVENNAKNSETILKQLNNMK